MRTIYKYSLAIADEQDVSMPKGSVILSVQAQNDVPCLWVLVEIPGGPLDWEVHKIAIYGTGNPVDHDVGRFIGTFQTMGGRFVGHVFEIP